MKKINVAVLFGGCSPEYQVSLASAYSVIRHMDQTRYLPVMIGITRNGTWFLFDGDVDKIAANTWCNQKDCTPAILSPSRNKKELLVFSGKETASVPLDVVFPVLHGKNGEDGTLQGLTELAGIPLAGCDTLASAVCMDKDMAHRLAGAAGILVPASMVFLNGTDPKDILSRIAGFRFPVYVKPVKSGSSLGITKVLKKENLADAVLEAFRFDDRIMVEEEIPGFEVGCAVMGNQELITGEVDEITLNGGFFDFTEKYQLINSVIHVPARIPAEKALEIKEISLRIYRTLGCRGFARVDLFLTPEGKIVFHEVNTIPGFTPHSRFPNMMKAAGWTFEEIISNIIESAVDK